MTCSQCGAPIDPGAATCKYCGQPVPVQQPVYQQPPYQQPIFRAPVVFQQPIMYNNNPNARAGIDPSWPVKNKMLAAILGIVLGGLGAHKFYLGNAGLGIIYLLFCWTGIPAIVGFVEGISYLITDDVSFQVKNRCRLQ